MLNVADLSITSLDTITAMDLAGANVKFILDELQDTTIANTEERENITGARGRLLNVLKRNKGVTISGTNGLLSAGMMGVQVGQDAVSGTSKVMMVDYLSIASNKATTSYTAAGTAGAEIVELYIKDTNGVATTKLEQAATAAEGKFAYAPATKELTFAEGAYADGTEIVVFYEHEVTGYVVNNDSDHFSGKVRMYIDGTAEDRCGNVYHIQFYIPKADFYGEFDIALGDSQTTHAFQAESLTGGSCGGKKNYLWTYTVFGVTDGDGD